MKNLIDKINALQEFFPRPASINIGGIEARIIYSKEPSGLYSQFDPEQERIAAYNEIMGLRVEAFLQLLDAVPSFEGVIRDITAGKSPDKLYGAISDIRKAFDEKPEVYGIWKTRLTTSTNMVLALDENGQETVFFYDGNPFANNEEFAVALSGEKSDGGIRYSEQAVERIRRETPPESRIAYTQYLEARGGNFTARDWMDHPVFSAACLDRELLKKYVFALQVLNLSDFFNQGWHSGWCPREMKPNFGRPVSLGYKADAFYPPNNATVEHAALVLKK